MTDTDLFSGVLPELRKAMQSRGFTDLSAVQRAVIDNRSQGRNLRISSQTGSGKTVAIGLAIGDDVLEKLSNQEKSSDGPLVLIIAPTRELAAQVSQELTWLFASVSNLLVGVVTGGTDLMRERRFFKKRPQIIVGTPGRLLDHIENGALKCEHLRHVVLDEADRMLDMGFRDELDAIVKALPEERQSHLVSATFAREVARFADRFQKDALHIEGTALGEANQDIEHIAHLVRLRDRYPALVNALLLARGTRSLIFVKRRADATEIAEMLAGDGFSALPFSGDLPQAQRTRTLSAFRNGIVSTLVATDVAARGIDVADIALVVHIDTPFDADTYTHRSGRTGRAGNKGKSLMLVAPQDQRRVQRILNNAKIEMDWQLLPDPKKIEKTLAKIHRRELHGSLNEGEQPNEVELEYAQKLLADYDPKFLVARLLDASAPTLPRSPMDVDQVQPRSEGRGRDDRAPQRYKVFAINWGKRTGATPARLLAHICGHTDIPSRYVGTLEIGSRETLFQIAESVAQDFEKLSAKPHPEHPDLSIKRGPDDALDDVARRGGGGGYGRRGSGERRGGGGRFQGNRGNRSSGGDRQRSSEQ